MKTLFLLASAVCLASFELSTLHAGEPLRRSDPEAQGVSSAELLDFIQAADKTIESMNSFMLVRHGHVVAEGWWSPYRADAPHSLYSLSKSFTSTAVGLAVAEGKLSVDDEVLQFFPEDAPKEPGNNLKAMRVSDLLRMSTGQQAEPARTSGEPWTKTFLKQAVPFKPGTHFLYNTSATYMLSAIVQKVTGTTVLDYLKPRLFGPLSIENPTWELSPQGISTGGYGLSIRTEDIARFGQLYLQKGKWHGKQIVPESWVDAATARQTSNGSNPNSDWDQGYGYQFWRARHGGYRGDGAFGQFCVVLPEQDAVIAITSGVGNMQAVLDLMWNKLLPAMKPSALTPNPDARTALERKLAALAIRVPEGSATPVKAASKKYVFLSNRHNIEAITLAADGQEGPWKLVMRVNGAGHKLIIGRGRWEKSRMGFGPFEEQPAAAAGAWSADSTFTAKLCFYETPFIVTLDLKFTDDKLELNSHSNVAFGPTRQPPLVGKPE